MKGNHYYKAGRFITIWSINTGVKEDTDDGNNDGGMDRYAQPRPGHRAGAADALCS